MLAKSQPDEIESFLSDASNMRGGHAASVIFPESESEVAEALREASRARTPVTVSGAGTGTVGGRIPFGGIVLATDRLNRIGRIASEDNGGRAVAQAGVVLADFQRAAEERGLLYPPDPTERSCFLGATVATNASGARTFKYGPTRAWVRRLRIALATGDVIELSRSQFFAGRDRRLSIPLTNGAEIAAVLPSYEMPKTRKNAAAYHVAPGMDAIDVFIGSEGTLGVITEVEVSLLPQPAGVLSGVVFFDSDENLLGFVRAARSASLETRRHAAAGRATLAGIDARALEYFDAESLRFLAGRYPRIPEAAAGAIFLEQETTAATEDRLMDAWLALLEQYHALGADSWFATNAADRGALTAFRHQLPVLVNEWLARHGQRKVSTDMAVPDAEFPAMLTLYHETLRAEGLRYVIFGHIGDNHLHVNIMPRNADEAARARALYLRFVRRAVIGGGTISAEHGIGKLKRDYLRVLYNDSQIAAMAALKRAFDPACILGRGNIFAEEYL